jgi:biotin-(acetyl-CoA carboxylase) ligase
MIPHALNGLTYVERLYCYTDSEHTSQVAKKIKEKPQKGIYVLQADKLTSGCEILNDTRGGFWVSFVVRLQDGCSLAFYKQAAALAIQVVLARSIDNKSVQIGWPNEIWCNGKIVGFINGEHFPGEEDVLIIGLELFINVFPDQIKSGLEEQYTTIFVETGSCQTIGTTLRVIVEEFDRNLHETANLLNRRYNEYLYGRGHNVTIDGKTGTLDHVDENGMACLMIDGKCVEIVSGICTYNNRI